jgi:uncharacterized damage-inducible protein DinB
VPDNDVLLDLFAHNCWANLILLEYCAGLEPQHLLAKDSAIYGDVVSTMQHVVSGGEALYWSAFSGQPPEWTRRDDEPSTLEEVTGWARDMSTRWQELLSRPIPSVVQRNRGDGSIVDMPASIVLLQAIHHGNVHREQISHVLTSLGLQPPDISGWRFGRDTGRFTVRGNA